MWVLELSTLKQLWRILGIPASLLTARCSNPIYKVKWFDIWLQWSAQFLPQSKTLTSPHPTRRSTYTKMKLSTPVTMDTDCRMDHPILWSVWVTDPGLHFLSVSWVSHLVFSSWHVYSIQHWVLEVGEPEQGSIQCSSFLLLVIAPLHEML